MYNSLATVSVFVGCPCTQKFNQFLIVTSNMLSQGMKSDFHKCSGSPDFSDTFPLSKCCWQISTPSKEDMASQIFLKPL